MIVATLLTLAHASPALAADDASPADGPSPLPAVFVGTMAVIAVAFFVWRRSHRVDDEVFGPPISLTERLAGIADVDAVPTITDVPLSVDSPEAERQLDEEDLRIDQEVAPDPEPLLEVEGHPETIDVVDVVTETERAGDDGEDDTLEALFDEEEAIEFDVLQPPPEVADHPDTLEEEPTSQDVPGPPPAEPGSASDQCRDAEEGSDDEPQASEPEVEVLSTDEPTVKTAEVSSGPSERPELNRPELNRPELNRPQLNGRGRDWSELPGADLPVTQIPGIGPVIGRDLARLGYTTVGDVASLSRSDRDELRTALGHDGWRLDHGRWVQRARRLLDPPDDN